MEDISKNKIWDYKSNKDDKLAQKVLKDNSIVMTKPTMAIELLKLIQFKEGDIVIEPCKGDGAFFNNFPKKTNNKWCEINEGVDFLNYNENVDYVISNPPFIPRKLFWDFHLKAMDISKKGIYWLINFASLNVFTTKRLDDMKNKGWYIQQLHIVNDKRWFGRYCFIHISKKKSNFITYDKTSY